MKFTREAWENAPKGAKLEWSANPTTWVDAYLIGFRKTGGPVVEASGDVHVTHNDRLCIILPKREVTVQLWRSPSGTEIAALGKNQFNDWTLLGEHTFEIDGE